MKHLQGKVISIPVKEVTEGMQVLTQYGICTVRAFKDNIVWILMLGNKNPLSFKDACLGYDYTLLVTELKTLVVEYKEEGHEDWAGDNYTGEPIWIDGKVKQLPLKYSQWQSVIDSGKVDSDKIVEFEIINRPYLDDRDIAKIIPQKSSWENIQAIAYDEWKEHGGLGEFNAWYINWLEDNYLPPNRK